MSDTSAVRLPEEEWRNGQREGLARLHREDPRFAELLTSQPRPGDVRFVESLLPQPVRDDPALRAMVRASATAAAIGLRLVDEQFGRDANRPKVHDGAVHRGVPHTYHNGTHTRDVVRESVAYAVNAPTGALTPREVVTLPIAAAFHDVVQGHGRGADESMSAALAVDVMGRTGFPFTARDRAGVYQAVMATSFNEQTKGQSIDPAKPGLHMQIAVATGDLAGLARPEGPAQGVYLAVEEFAKHANRFGVDLGQSLRQAGVDTRGWSARGYMEFIGSDPGLNNAFAAHLKGQAGFFRAHRYPSPETDARLGFREANARLLDTLNAKVETEHISPQQVSDGTRIHRTLSTSSTFTQPIGWASYAAGAHEPTHPAVVKAITAGFSSPPAIKPSMTHQRQSPAAVNTSPARDAVRGISPHKAVSDRQLSRDKFL
ncbi:hypothetical protein LO772_01535 [Yinghuangia sp. ASG 101]|uniref:hypothetical protein n=1 Tax=Yinghuangia sp. ASG 101 TaxID=2896848 RepID=UPI001E366DD3|nr:hypothetical protein [Yinghuangia sp. ASG 101]UGQ12321.1 hypothetical protein LO772_01535 [Yinghuangia sp. ASG 101]